ncbi:hypothetical protein HYW94_00930 [Candidatus Uhrbacteria bacterium]|nr:hypothetical protein [Candidatus Uhrbacteria bacterium]
MSENISQNLTDEELEKSYWFLTHKDRILRMIAMTLGIICFFIWAIAIFLAVRIIFIPWQDYQGMLSDLKKQYSSLLIRPLVQDIQKDSVSFIQSEEGTYDLYVRVKNPNSLWLAYVDAVFSADESPLPPQKAFLLPEEEKYLMFPGLKRTSQPTTLGLEFQNISWNRVSKKEKEEMPQKLRFTVKDIKIAPIQQIEGGAISYTKLTFKILNETVYRFWDISVPLLVKTGDQIIAINTIPLTNFGFGETRAMESRWYADLSNATAVDILPTVDIFNPGLYQAPTVQELEERSPDVIKQEEELLRQQQEEQQQFEEPQ